MELTDSPQTCGVGDDPSRDHCQVAGSRKEPEVVAFHHRPSPSFNLTPHGEEKITSQVLCHNNAVKSTKSRCEDT